jgi:hypothetical protein
LDSACQGLYSGKKYTKIKTKTRIQFECIKILKNMHILVHNQNFEKQQKWNSKILKPKFLLNCEQNMLKKVVMEINGLIHYVTFGPWRKFQGYYVTIPSPIRTILSQGSNVQESKVQGSSVTGINCYRDQVSQSRDQMFRDQVLKGRIVTGIKSTVQGSSIRAQQSQPCRSTAYACNCCKYE